MVKRVLIWLYGCQLLLVMPWFLGAMYRDEQSLWVGTAVKRSMQRSGPTDAVLTAYLYALYYSAFLLFPYWILGFRYRDPFLRLLLSVWFAFSAAMFAQPAFAFIRSIPSDIANGWLLIVWILTTVFMGFVVKTLERDSRSNT